MAPPALTSATTTPGEARNPWHRQRPQRTSTPPTPPPPDGDYPQTKNSSTTNNQYTTHGTPPLPTPPSPPRHLSHLHHRWPPIGLAGGSNRPLGWAPRPPQAGAPGSLKQTAPHWPCRRLQTPPGLGSPSPPGRCARFSEADGPPLALQEARNTPWAGLPVPPRQVRPGLCRWWPLVGLAGGSRHPLGWTPRPPRAGVPGS